MRIRPERFSRELRIERLRAEGLSTKKTSHSKSKKLVGSLVLEIWDLFVSCDLVLGIYYFLGRNNIRQPVRLFNVFGGHHNRADICLLRNAHLI